MRIHFVGIGGIGMSSIALHEFLSGTEVYGSNIEENERTRYLRKMGIDIFIGHSERNWKDPDFLVRTPAVSRSNPEVFRALREKIPVFERIDFLREIVSGKEQFAVTGTDGKTTTTAMLAHVLKYLKKDPTVFLGGIHSSLEHGNYRKGSDVFVYELDESDGKFSSFSPNYAIITNARGDHIEKYDWDLGKYKKAFETFAKSVKEVLVTFAEDEITGKLGMISFGLNHGTYTIERREQKAWYQEVSIRKNGKRYGQLVLKVPGLHNALNALAVFSLLDFLGCDLGVVSSALEDFEGVKRRFNVTYADEDRRIFIIDDYAHTPQEVENLLKTTKEIFRSEKITVIFQPHRYTRLMREDGNFARSLREADHVIVTEVFGAYENERRISAEMIHESLMEIGKDSSFVPNKEDILKKLEVTPCTVYLFVGAGDIIEVSKRFKMKLSDLKKFR